MNQTVTLLLLLESGSLTATERRELATFQTREKVVLTSPVAGLPTGAPSRHDEQVVARIEASLDEAETFAASLDEAKALTVLASVEQTLLRHPELPQAAWLMAERHRLAAAIRAKQPDGAADVEALLASARALEGPRAATFGETASEQAPATPVVLDVRDLDRADVFVLDGRRAARTESLLPGLHHARVLRDSSLVWSGWFDVPARQRVDRLLGVPPRVACSVDDLRAVAAGTRTPIVPSGVRCGRWIGVRRGKTRLEVAWCEGARCSAYGPLLHEPKPERASALPPWAAAAIVGAATLAAGSILVFSGAFDRERPPPVTVQIYKGPR